LYFSLTIFFVFFFFVSEVLRYVAASYKTTGEKTFYKKAGKVISMMKLKLFRKNLDKQFISITIE